MCNFLTHLFMNIGLIDITDGLDVNRMDEAHSKVANSNEVECKN